MMRLARPGPILRAVLGFVPSPARTAAGRDWPVDLGDAERTQAATLRQIHPGNVHRLVPSRTYRAGDAEVAFALPRK